MFGARCSVWERARNEESSATVALSLFSWLWMMARVEGLRVKAHRLLYHSSLGVRVIKKKKVQGFGFLSGH